MDVALQLLQLLTVYSRMHTDAPIKSRDKSLWVYTDYSLTHIHRSAPARVVGGEVETTEIILFIAAAETSSPSSRKETL